MSKTAFVFSNPYTQSVRRDDLAPFLEGLLTSALDDDFDYTPVLLSVSTVPNSNMVTVVYAFRYEVEK